MRAIRSRSESPLRWASRLAIGAFNGALIAYFGFPPFVVTLGMLSIARSLATIVSNNTVVFQFGPGPGKVACVWAAALGSSAFPTRCSTCSCFALLTGFVLRWTKFGRYVFAIGGNEKAAIVTGVPVQRVKLAVYVISALAAGVAGVIETGWLGAVTTNLGTGYELQVIASTVIGGANLAGGAGTAVGALIGSALIEVIRNSLSLARHQSVLAGPLHRQPDHHRRRLRPHSQLQRSGIVGRVAGQ